MTILADYLIPGTGPLSDGSPGSGALGAYPMEVFETPSLDLTKTYSGIELIPARPGYLPFLLLPQWMITIASGTQTSGATAQAGSNAAHTNFFNTTANTPSNAAVNAAVGNTPCRGGNPSAATSTLRRFTNRPVLMDITVGAQGTGNFALACRFIAIVGWVPTGDA